MPEGERAEAGEGDGRAAIADETLGVGEALVASLERALAELPRPCPIDIDARAR